MEKHINLLGILHIVFGTMFLIGTAVIYLLITTADIISGEELLFFTSPAVSLAIFLTGIVGTIIGVFFLMVAIPGIIGGIGLLKYRHWAKVLTLTVGIINLINFPIGTVLGIYTMWVLMNSQSEKIFEKRQE